MAQFADVIGTRHCRANSVLSGCEVEPKQAIKQTTAPMIIKTLKGSQGIGVILAEHPQSATSILETLKDANVPVLLQDLSKRQKGQIFAAL